MEAAVQSHNADRLLLARLWHDRMLADATARRKFPATKKISIKKTFF